jgi:hypothetical protein
MKLSLVSRENQPMTTSNDMQTIGISIRNMTAELRGLGMADEIEFTVASSPKGDGSIDLSMVTGGKSKTIARGITALNVDRKVGKLIEKFEMGGAL